MKLLQTAKASILVMAMAPLASGAIISSWGFEGLSVSATASTSPSPTAGNLNSDTGNGLFNAVHASASTVWSTPVGNGSAKSLSANNWAVADYWEWTSDTTGFNGINVLLDATRSSTGPTDFKLQYSTTGTGGTYVDAPSGGITLTLVTFSSVTENFNTPPKFLFDLSSISGLDNNPNAAFRLTVVTTGSAATGTSRIDNVIVGTDLAIPEPTGAAVLCGALGLLMRRRRD